MCNEPDIMKYINKRKETNRALKAKTIEIVQHFPCVSEFLVTCEFDITEVSFDLFAT